MARNLLALISFIFSSLPDALPAQTCCSGGVPIASNLGLPATEAYNLQVTLSYDLNILRTLKEGLEKLDDDSPNRTTKVVLWELGYSITDRLSIDALFSYVRQERTIRNGLNQNFVFTDGPGDAVVLLKYRLWQRKDQGGNWTLGIGGKLPGGASDKSTDQGLLLNADLQPGSGAWDGLFWTQLIHTGLFRPSAGIFTTLTHNRRGINRNYLPVVDAATGETRGQNYQFGNEWQWIFGISDHLLLGKLILDPGVRIKTHQLIETSWGKWKAWFPETKVVSANTGYSRNYGNYPYGDYRTNNSSLLFPVAQEDNRLPWKERVLGVISPDGAAQAYRFENVVTQGLRVLNDAAGGSNIVVAGSKSDNFIVAFLRDMPGGVQLTFSALRDALPVIMADQEGNQWNLFGEAVSGPRAGQQLTSADAFIGYWVAWGAFYPDLIFR